MYNIDKLQGLIDSGQISPRRGKRLLALAKQQNTKETLEAKNTGTEKYKSLSPDTTQELPPITSESGEMVEGWKRTQKTVDLLDKLQNDPEAKIAWEKTKPQSTMPKGMNTVLDIQKRLPNVPGMGVQDQVMGPELEGQLQEKYPDKTDPKALSEFRAKYDPEGLIAEDTVKLRDPNSIVGTDGSIFVRNLVNGLAFGGDVLPEQEMSALERSKEFVNSKKNKRAEVLGRVTGSLSGMLILSSAMNTAGITGPRSTMNKFIMDAFRQNQGLGMKLSNMASSGTFFVSRQLIGNLINNVTSGEWADGKDIGRVAIAGLTGAGLGLGASVEGALGELGIDAATGFLSGLLDSANENGEIDLRRAGESAIMYSLFALLSMPGRSMRMKLAAKDMATKNLAEAYAKGRFAKTGTSTDFDHAMKVADRAVNIGIRKAGGIENMKQADFYKFMNTVNKTTDKYYNSMMASRGKAVIKPTITTPKDIKPQIKIPLKKLAPPTQKAPVKPVTALKTAVEKSLEMTKQEMFQNAVDFRASRPQDYKTTKLTKYAKQQIEDNHRNVLQNAIDAGYTIEPRVLKDYPELEQPTTKPVTALKTALETKPYKTDIKNKDVTFTEEMKASYKGQKNLTIKASKGDRQLGYVDYVEYNGEPSISYIEVAKEFSGKGVGKDLVRAVQKEYPDAIIKWGMTTPSGTKLKESMDKELVTPPKPVTALKTAVEKKPTKMAISTKEYKTESDYIEAHTLYHGGNKDFIKKLLKTKDFRPGASREAGTGGNRYGLSTTTDHRMAKDFSTSSSGSPAVGKIYVDPNAKVLDYKGKDGEFLDNMSVKEIKKLAEDYDIIRDINNVGGENEVRVLNSDVLRDESQIASNYELLKYEVKKPPTAPEVKPDALTVEARKYKTVEEFVKNKKVVFHGTGKKFDIHNIKPTSGEFGGGIYFTEDKDTASFHADRSVRQSGEGKAEVLKVYLDIKNPYTFRMYDPNNTNKDKTMPTKSTLIRRGHDGVIGYTLNDSKEIVAFSPDQIKTKEDLVATWKEAHTPSKVTHPKTTEIAEVDIYEVGRQVGMTTAKRNMTVTLKSKKTDLAEKQKMLTVFANSHLHKEWKQKALKNIARMRSERSVDRVGKIINRYIELSQRKDAYNKLAKAFDGKHAIKDFKTMPLEWKDRYNSISGFRDMFDRNGKVRQKDVIDMSTDEMRSLTGEVIELNHLRATEKKIKIGKEYYDFNTVAKDPILESILKKPLRRAVIKRLEKGDSDVSTMYKPIEVRGLKRVFNLEMTDPKLIEERIDHSESGPVKKFFSSAFHEGSNKKIKYQRDVEELFDKGLEGIDKKKILNMSEFFGKKPEIQTIDLDTGRKVKITGGQKITLGLLYKNAHSFEHLISDNGGFRLRVRTKGGMGISDNVYRLSPEEIDQILATTTPEEKQISDTAHKYFNEYSNKKLNEVSLDLYGFEKFLEEDYFPVTTSALDRFVKDLEDKGQNIQASMKNMGFTKDRLKNAEGPIIIDDVFYTVSKAISQHSGFYGQAVPLENAKKILADSDISNRLRERWGQQYLDSITEYVEDVEGGSLRSDYLERSFQKILNNYAVSVLGFKPFVMIGQLGSLINASVEPGFDLPKLVVAKATSKEEMSKYSDMMWDRFMKGAVTPEVGEIGLAGEMKRFWLKKKTFQQKQMAGIIKLDSIAIGKIWTVAKNNIKKANSDWSENKIGKATAKEVERVVRSTQPMSDVVDKPAILRHRRIFAKGFTMFMSARAQTYSNIFRVYDRFERSGKGTKDLLNLVKSLSKLLLLLPMFYVGRNQVRDVAKGRKPRTEGKQILSDIIEMNMGNVAVMGPLISSIKSKIERGAYAGYDVTSPIYDMLNEVSMLVASTVNLGDNKVGSKKYNKKIRRILDKTVGIVAKIKGLPYSGVKEIGTIAKNIVGTK